MKRIILVLCFINLGFTPMRETKEVKQETVYVSPSEGDKVNNTKMFNEMVNVIKRHETIHKPKHYPYIGYGHKHLKSDKFKLPITKKLAEQLLIKDLKLKMQCFKGDFKTKLLLGALAYNIGEYKLLNGNKTAKTTIVKMFYDDKTYTTSQLKAEYIKWCYYNDKEHARIKIRRGEEFDVIFNSANHNKK